MPAAIYVYCVVKAAEKPAPAGVPAGLPDAARPELLDLSSDLWLVACEVPLDIYGPGNLEPALGDMEWVGRVALAHEAVVEYFATRAGITVIPMKLFTMFSTRERAVADLTRRKPSIESAMKRIAGSEEWGIRVHRSAAPAVSETAPSAVRSGAAFLAAKKQKRDDLRQARVAAAEAALSAFERLSAMAKDSRRREDAPAAGATPPLLDAAFLVPAAHREKFTAAAQREAEACARAGAQLTLSGPWPAYNFIQDDRQ